MTLIPEPGVTIKAEVTKPRVVILFGATKVGKTYNLSLLEDHLILDFEGGAKMYDCRHVQIDSLKKMKEVYDALKKAGRKEKVLAIDTVDRLVQIATNMLLKQHGKDSLQDFDFGQGYYFLKENIMKIVKMFEEVCETLVIIGHRKRNLVGADQILLDTKSLDLPGNKLVQELVAHADTIGYMFRDPEDKKLMVSFEPTADSGAESGSRFTRGIMPFSWPHILDPRNNPYIEETPVTVEENESAPVSQSEHSQSVDFTSSTAS